MSKKLKNWQVSRRDNVFEKLFFAKRRKGERLMGNFCGRCGAVVENNVCSGCGAQYRSEAPSTTNYSPPLPKADTAPAPPKTSSGGYGVTRAHSSNGFPLLAENEKVVRSYICSDLVRPKTTGYLTVTNKRVIFHASAAASRVVQEVKLDSVSALDCFVGVNIRWIQLLVGIALGLFGLKGLFSYQNTLLTIVELFIAGVLIFNAIRRSFFLNIYSSSANSIPIRLGAGIQGLFGNGALYSLVGTATMDTDRMISELGALVQDLQTLGDHAMDKWCK